MKCHHSYDDMPNTWMRNLYPTEPWHSIFVKWKEGKNWSRYYKLIKIIQINLQGYFLLLFYYSKEEGSLRVMNTDKLLKTLPVLQAQLDGLLEFDCQANDLTNGKNKFVKNISKLY